MTISYKWLNEYLPLRLDPERLSKILTSVGLEVEKLEKFHEVKGGLRGLVIGEVLDVQQHPNADKLKVTKVKTGENLLQIVCGAPNVATGQKVIVAPVGTSIHPTGGEPVTMKVAKIRGIESYGMICAEDEIGLGTSHEGIMILPDDATVGLHAEDYFKPYDDYIFEIGLTPNRMDAMSHWGVARDVCAYLVHHDKMALKPLIPETSFTVDEELLDITITVEDTDGCKRYSGVCLDGVKVGDSPKWLQERLKSIGIRPINNIVDITNFIQHETGQPLHAFDYDAIKGKTIVVKTLEDSTPFTTLDEKERKLSEEDLMICDIDGPMCIAGVFGGLHSGVTESTRRIFLESAFFDPSYIRKSSFRHNLRTDAASRFEKGTDISATVPVLKRAAMLIKEVAGGIIASEILDVYPLPEAQTEIALKYHYLKKLSGKIYHPDTVKNILESLDFVVVREGIDAMVLHVPYHKPDVTIPADVVEEILRIDGLDNIDIPTSITISPSVSQNEKSDLLTEKISSVLTGLGFTEILTNSITNSAYFDTEQLHTSVKLINALSKDLDILRPSMLHTALDVIAFNNNRKNTNLKFFEFGKTYSTDGVGKYHERTHLSLYVTGTLTVNHWKTTKATDADIFYLKGTVETLLRALGVSDVTFEERQSDKLKNNLVGVLRDETIVELGIVGNDLISKFEIKQPVLFADIYWDKILHFSNTKTKVKEIPKYPVVERDLAIIVAKTIHYDEIHNQIKKLKINKLQEIRLFDIFESEKLGSDKRSLAVNITFLDEEKTLTDKEIDGWMNKIMSTLEKQLDAEIRK